MTPSPAQAVADLFAQFSQPTSVLSSGALGQFILGIAVSQDVLDAAEQATGTQVTTSDTPQYRKLSEPLSYGQLDMEKCLFTCRYECETGNEIIAIDGFPVRNCYLGPSHAHKCLDNLQGCAESTNFQVCTGPWQLFKFAFLSSTNRLSCRLH